MPKPWPEKPAAKINPGTPGTSPIPGTPSGVLSTKPAHACVIHVGSGR